MTTPYITICKRAILHYGPEVQKVKALEELAELQCEITHEMGGRGDYNHVAEEIADVEIMLEQLKQMYNIRARVDRERQRKITRLKERMDNDGE